MNREELIALATARHGKHWKMPLAQETGWSYWTLHRAAKGTIEITPKLEKALRALPKKTTKGQ